MSSNRLLLCVAVNLLCSFVFANPPVVFQIPDKVVEWSKTRAGSYPETTAPGIQSFRQIDGIEIEEIAVNGKAVTVGKPFAADDDWLKNLTVRVKNTSSQPLTAVQLTLVLPELRIPPQIAYCYPSSDAEKGKSIMPGGEVTLKMPEGGFYDWVRDQIAKDRPLSQVAKAEIYTTSVTLPDGMQWVSGCVKTVDPRNACPIRNAQ